MNTPVPRTNHRTPPCTADHRLRSRSGRRAALAAAWLTTGLFLFVAGNIGPFIALLLPVMLPGMIGLIGGVHAWADADPECPACGAALVAETAPDPVDWARRPAPSARARENGQLRDAA